MPSTTQFLNRAYKDPDTLNYCHYCDVYLPRERATVDHVLAKRQGGKNSDDNFVLSCKVCNGYKGKRFIEDCQHVVIYARYQLIARAFQLTGRVDTRPLHEGDKHFLRAMPKGFRQAKLVVDWNS